MSRLSKWTHACCPQCFRRVTGRNPETASRLTEPDPETCCYCEKQTTAGIYLRDDPRRARCGGVH